MTREEAVTERVMEDLRDHLRDLQRYGPAYVEDYAKAILGPATPLRPKVRMHPKLAALVRELVLDAATMDRRGTLEARRTPDLDAVTSKTRGRSRPTSTDSTERSVGSVVARLGGPSRGSVA